MPPHFRSRRWRQPRSGPSRGPAGGAFPPRAQECLRLGRDAAFTAAGGSLDSRDPSGTRLPHRVAHRLDGPVRSSQRSFGHLRGAFRAPARSCRRPLVYACPPRGRPSGAGPARPSGGGPGRSCPPAPGARPVRPGPVVPAGGGSDAVGHPRPRVVLTWAGRTGLVRTGAGRIGRRGRGQDQSGRGGGGGTTAMAGHVDMQQGFALPRSCRVSRPCGAGLPAARCRRHACPGARVSRRP